MPVCVLHHPVERHSGGEVAPVVTPLGVTRSVTRRVTPLGSGRPLTYEPAHVASAICIYPPRPESTELGPLPPAAALSPGERHPRALVFLFEYRAGRRSRCAPAHRDAEAVCDDHHVALLSLIQGVEEGRLVAVVGIDRHTAVRHTERACLVEERERYLGPGPKIHLLGHTRATSCLCVRGPALEQVEPGVDGPGNGPLGVVAGERYLAVTRLAQRPGLLPLDSGRALPLRPEAGAVENDHGVALGGECEHLLDALSVQVIFVPGHVGEEILQLLLARARYDLGNSVAVLVWALGEEPAHVSLEHHDTWALDEVHREQQDLTSIYEASSTSTKQYWPVQDPHNYIRHGTRKISSLRSAYKRPRSSANCTIGVPAWSSGISRYGRRESGAGVGPAPHPRQL